MQYARKRKTTIPRPAIREASVIRFLGFLALLLSAPATPAQVMSGGNYQISSSVQAGGGGASTGSGNKVIEGTAGQTAAGGPYSTATLRHDAGFWPTTLAAVTATP